MGWTLDPQKQMDYIAYGVADSGWCWFLPAAALRQVALRSWPHWWQRRGRWIVSRTTEWGPEYRTFSVSVPWDDLLPALGVDPVRHRVRW
jgi:hypothetical protein